jgi:general secretion pathway protein G
MIYLQERPLPKTERGDAVIAVELPGRRVILSRLVPARLRGSGNRRNGFTLIELVITVAVLSILTLGVVPLMKLSVKRQKEAQLRDELRHIRMAIDEFHRDTVGINCTANTLQGGGGQQAPPLDPRSRVVISDCTIFGVDNPDRYPPTLETLIEGVNVIPRGSPGGLGGQGLQGTGTDINNTNTVLGNQLSTKKKVYLRGIPIDPMTGAAEWELRSCYDPADSDSWGGENVFDVRSKSKEKALNGEKYSDW